MRMLAQVPIGDNFGSPFGIGRSTLGDLVSLILKAAFAIAGILILFFLVYAGFQIIVGAGQNNPEAAKKGKEAATAAVTGFIIVFVAYWIIKIIELVTGSQFITNPGL